MIDEDLREQGHQAATTMLALAAELFGAEGMESFAKGALESCAAALALYSSPAASGNFCAVVSLAISRAGEERIAEMN